MYFNIELFIVVFKLFSISFTISGIEPVLFVILKMYLVLKICKMMSLSVKLTKVS